MNIEIFLDVDWAGSITDKRSSSDYCTYIWGISLHDKVKNSSWLQEVVSRLI